MLSYWIMMGTIKPRDIFTSKVIDPSDYEHASQKGPQENFALQSDQNGYGFLFVKM